MKSSRASYILAGVMGVALAATLSWGLKSREALRQEQERTSLLMQRVSAVARRTKPVSVDRTELEQKLAEESQRAAAAAATYEEEKNTHEPLRRQVEKMVEQGFRLNQELTNRDARVAELSRTLEEGRGALSASTTSNQTLSTRVRAAEAEKAVAVKAQADVQERLNKAQADIGGLTAAMAAAKAKSEDLDRKLAAAEQRATAAAGELARSQELLKQEAGRVVEWSNRLFRADSAPVSGPGASPNAAAKP